MKTRAELANEPRTMQFEIMQMCPEVLRRRPDLAQHWGDVNFPVRVWVWLPAVELDAYDYCGAASVWLVATGPVIAADAGRRPAVCGHMGRLIE